MPASMCLPRRYILYHYFTFVPIPVADPEVVRWARTNYTLLDLESTVLNFC